MLELSARHESDSVAASQRLRAVTERKEAAESTVVRLEQRITSLQQELVDQIQTGKERCEALGMHTEDTQGQQRQRFDQHLVRTIPLQTVELRKHVVYPAIGYIRTAKRRGIKAEECVRSIVAAT